MTKPTIVHVNRSHIAANTKDGGNRPVYTIKINGVTRYGREVIFHGASRAVYSNDPLSCGARAWIETTHPVTIVDEMSFSEAKTSL